MLLSPGSRPGVSAFANLLLQIRQSCYASREKMFLLLTRKRCSSPGKGRKERRGKIMNRKQKENFAGCHFRLF